MQFQFSQLSFPENAEVVINDVSWADFERFMDELGDRSSLRISFNQMRMHVIAPSVGHEMPKVYIGDFISYLLEKQELDFESLGSVTLHKQSVQKAVEADQCFYIEHAAAIRGKRQISLDSDPPPDLAVEIDIYSPTDRALYAALGVPELWIYDGKQLVIWVLQAGEYHAVEFSPHFPGLALREKIPALLSLAEREGRMVAMKAFRAWVGENL
ncbi:Uma2 family endonuclease [Thiothrix winogradskyi]|uniref:Uma2 family endonuclease n=1 Tax=Thiothrix winogradskyi TaxID=96472 RepID=A0ABY3T3Z2_9GAMM|nr:Uma2 family endonuclease [Thiothrix winogradskyi]UJS25964.1 Uma2 family endonuclease [Thiothrix winogradskyi]